MPQHEQNDRSSDATSPYSTITLVNYSASHALFNRFQSILHTKQLKHAVVERFA